MKFRATFTAFIDVEAENEKEARTRASSKVLEYMVARRRHDETPRSYLVWNVRVDPVEDETPAIEAQEADTPEEAIVPKADPALVEERRKAIEPVESSEASHEA